MNLKRCGRRWSLSLAMGGVFSFLGASAGQALTYSSGDLIGVFVNNGVELMVDMGPLSSITNGQIFTFGTPSNFGSTGALGGIFTAFETNAPFSGTVRSITLTTDPSVNPPSFDNNFSLYVPKIPAAQSALDAAGTVSGGGWLENLNSFPNAGTGGVILNDAQRLAILTTNPSSYTKVINSSGLNNLNGTMPFSTAVMLAANGQLADLWDAKRTALTTSSTTLLGTLTVDGNALGDGSEVRISFSAVPEPGTIFLLSMGLLGLTRMGGRRRSD